MVKEKSRLSCCSLYRGFDGYSSYRVSPVSGLLGGVTGVERFCERRTDTLSTSLEGSE